MGLRARLDEFFLGVLAAWANLHTPRHSRRRSVAISIGALALVALLPSIAARGDLFVRADYPWLLIHYDVVGVLLALIVFGAAGAGRWSSVVLANRPILGLGMISFSVYLWHYPVFQWSVALGLWGYTSRFTAAVIVVLATLAIAWISYECIESRFLRKDVVAE